MSNGTDRRSWRRASLRGHRRRRRVTGNGCRASGGLPTSITPANTITDPSSCLIQALVQQEPPVKTATIDSRKHVLMREGARGAAGAVGDETALS